MSQTLTFEDLQKLTGFDRASDIIRCLHKQGVPVVRGRHGRPFTTVDAINQSLGVDVDSGIRPQDEV
jgi:S1-C subfamily serine protease